MNPLYVEAAAARSLAVRSTADRPSHRRCAEAETSQPLARVRATRIELRESATEDRDSSSSSSSSLHFTGYGTVYNAGYEMYDAFGPYTELVAPGAGTASLATPGLDVPLVLAHDSLRRIARTTNGSLTLTEDDNGLRVDAPNLDPSDSDVGYIVPKLRSGLVDEMSFRFRITSGSWSPDWSEYHVDAYDIHRGDVSIVGYGANPATAGSGLRSLGAEQLDKLTDDELRELEQRLRSEHGRRSLGMTFDELDRLDRSTLVGRIAFL